MPHLSGLPPHPMSGFAPKQERGQKILRVNAIVSGCGQDIGHPHCLFATDDTHAAEQSSTRREPMGFGKGGPEALGRLNESHGNDATCHKYKRTLHTQIEVRIVVATKDLRKI
eukprot:GHVT01085866.1.p1 GENE.GHVT01085866.1~~GHVT01085866.1.p1  ORF type:complete len:113 (-),score=11.44 GHVT01085866.1:1341-1679(-)